MRTDRELDELYDRASPTPGWLSCLLDAHAIDDPETEYLVWRDECDAPVKRKMKVWEAQIEAHGGIELENAETQEEQLLAVTKRLSSVDKLCYGQLWEVQQVIMETARYRQLLALRAQLRLETDPPKSMPQDMVERAREYRLDDLLAGKLVKKFMKCPVHPEKHSSFYVTSFGFCFGCLRSWNSIGWLMDFDHMTFRQAVEFLAQKPCAGI